MYMETCGYVSVMEKCPLWFLFSEEFVTKTFNQSELSL